MPAARLCLVWLFFVNNPSQERRMCWEEDDKFLLLACHAVNIPTIQKQSTADDLVLCISFYSFISVVNLFRCCWQPRGFSEETSTDLLPVFGPCCWKKGRVFLIGGTLTHTQESVGRGTVPYHTVPYRFRSHDASKREKERIFYLIAYWQILIP